MASFATDLQYGAITEVLILPQTLSDNGPLDPVDLSGGSFSTNLILCLGSLASGTTVAVTVEESEDGGVWTPMADGQVVANAAGAVVVKRGTRSERYLRANVTLTGPGPEATLAMVAVAQRQYVFDPAGGNSGVAPPLPAAN